MCELNPQSTLLTIKDVELDKKEGEDGWDNDKETMQKNCFEHLSLTHGCWLGFRVHEGNLDRQETQYTIYELVCQKQQLAWM